MKGISNDIILTLMHSIWQSFALYVFFVIRKKTIDYKNPSTLKSILMAFIVGQPIISIFTFSILRFNPALNFFNSDFIIRATSISINQSIVDCIFPLYLVMVIIKLADVRIKWNKEKSFITEGLIVPSEAFLTLANQTLERFSSHKATGFYVHPNISSPLTLGFWKPIVVFPVALLNNLTIEETIALITHEISHIQKNDFISNQMNIILKQVYFFNPFFQKLSSSFILETETTCDQFVLKAQNPLVYALALKKTAEFSIQTNHLAALCATGKTNALAYRISQFKHLSIRNHPSTRGSIFSIASMLLIITIATFFWALSIRKIDFINKPISFVTKSTSNKSSFFKQEEKKSNINKLEVIYKKSIKEVNILSTQQEDLFISLPTIDVQLTSKSDNSEKQLLVQEESNGQRTTSAYAIKNEQGEFLQTWLWTIQENIETKDSVYSDTLVPFHEYVEDLR